MGVFRYRLKPNSIVSMLLVTHKDRLPLCGLFTSLHFLNLHKRYPPFIHILNKGGMMMNQLVLLFLTAILAGFGLIVVTSLASSFITSTTIVNFLIAVGTIAVIVFAFSVLYIAIKALFQKNWM